MSFYLNDCNTKKPMCLRGNSSGPCEKILIEVPRVFDACLLRDENINYVLNLTNFTPANPTYPLTFVSATNNGASTITSTTYDNTDCRGNFSRVTVGITVPVTVSYTDSAGVSGTATGTINITKCAILVVPQDGLVGVSTSVQVNFFSSIGSFTGETTVSITGCMQVIIKIVATVDVLVPSYGYPCIPMCNECSPSSCNVIFNEPIYPTI